jgi:hypothetical protein
MSSVFFCMQAAKDRKISSSFFVGCDWANAFCIKTLPTRCNLIRLRHKVMTLCADDARLGKFAYFQGLADFFGWQ